MKKFTSLIWNILLFVSILSIMYVIFNFKSITQHIWGIISLNMLNEQNIEFVNDSEISNNIEKKESWKIFLYDNSEEVKNNLEYNNFSNENLVNDLIYKFSEFKNENNSWIIESNKEKIERIKKEQEKLIKEQQEKEKKKKETQKKKRQEVDFFKLSTEIPKTGKEAKYLKWSYVVIPKINVEAPIFYPSINLNNLEDEIMKLLEKGVVHRPETQLPYQNGNFFILWHSSNFAWLKSDYNDVFAKIDLLKEWDEVYVYYEGRKYTYKLYEKKVVDPSAIEEYGYIPWRNLSIMTCYPIWSIKNRLIAKFRLQIHK